MRDLPTQMQANLESGSTTHTHCWILTRKDGVTFGFTDHDVDILLLGTSCKAASGFTRSEITEKQGFSITGGDIEGALSHDLLSESDIQKGLYDAAKVSLYLVDWTNPSLYFLQRVSFIGEISRQGAHFKAEMRSRLAEFDTTRGRHFNPSCDARLGDSFCKVTLTELNSAVTEVFSASSFRALGVTDDYRQGKLTWLTGNNAGVSVEIQNGGEVVSLWQEMLIPLQVGDTFKVTKGCDKSFATCVSKFNNGVNFRGFPHIPGNDFLTRYPLPGETGHDGSALR